MAVKQLTTDEVQQAVATLNEFRTLGATLVPASKKKPTDYLVCAQSAQGHVTKNKPEPYHYQSLTPAGLDLWGMGYRVVAGKSAYQRNGAIYGFERSYAKARKDTEGKARTLVNGKQQIVPGSLYIVPGYLIAKTDYEKLKAALDVAYRAWVDPENVLGGWPPSTNIQMPAVVIPPPADDGVSPLNEIDVPAPGPEIREEQSESPDEREALGVLDELERRVEVSQRVEQSLLRKHLLSSSATTGECALCGRTISVRYLVAAHIKQRSACSDAEKLDFSNIAMLNCKFGCDELYEQGDVSVAEDWSVVVNPSLADETARAYIERTIQPSISPRPAAAEYFAWHRQHHNFD